MINEVDLCRKLIVTTRDIVWALRSDPTEESIKDLATASVVLRHLILGEASEVYRRKRVIWSSERGREDIYEQFRKGVNSLAETLVAVRNARMHDLDWTHARLKACGFADAIAELDLFAIRCYSLTESVTENEARVSLQKRRDLDVSGIKPLHGNAAEVKSRVDESSLNLHETWPTRRDSWPRKLAEKVRELSLQGNSPGHITKAVRKLPKGDLPVCFQDRDPPRTWPSKGSQERYIKMLNSIEKYENQQAGEVGRS